MHNVQYSLPDALAFAPRCDVHRLLLFHHDPCHNDAFSRHSAGKRRTAGLSSVAKGRVELGREGDVFDLAEMAISPHGLAEAGA